MSCKGPPLSLDGEIGVESVKGGVGDVEVCLGVRPTGGQTDASPSLQRLGVLEACPLALGDGEAR